MSETTQTKKTRSGFTGFLMGLIATILCIVLFVVTLAGALALDLRAVTSADGFEKILTQMFISSASAQSESGTLIMLSDSASSDSASLTTPITDLFYELLQEAFGDEVPMTKESVNEFISKSTAPALLAEKISGTIDDFINETANTTVTKDELMGLIRENVPLIEEHFELEISDEALDEMEGMLGELPLMQEMEQTGLMTILEGYLAKDGNEETLDSVRQTLRTIRMITSDETMLAALGVFLILAVLILLANWSLSKTLSDIGISVLVAGGLLSVLSILISSNSLPLPIPQLSMLMGLIQTVAGTFAIVHYTIAGAGAALIAGSIVLRIFKRR